MRIEALAPGDVLIKRDAQGDVWGRYKVIEMLDLNPPRILVVRLDGDTPIRTDQDILSDADLKDDAGWHWQLSKKPVKA